MIIKLWSNAETFKINHADSRKALDKLKVKLAKANPNNVQDVLNIANKTDYIKTSDGQFIFNVCGNKYRAVISVTIAGNDSTCYITKIMTHSEYDEWCKSMT